MDSRIKLEDLQTGEPIANAHVYVNGDLYPTTSDQNGFMLIKGITSFPYKVDFSHVSYGNKQGTSINAGPLQVVKLIRQSVELPEIEIKPDLPKPANKTNGILIFIVILIVGKLLKLY
jgi:hypothetical protein